MELLRHHFLFYRFTASWVSWVPGHEELFSLSKKQITERYRLQGANQSRWLFPQTPCENLDFSVMSGIQLRDYNDTNDEVSPEISIRDQITQSFIDARFTAPLAAILCTVLAYQLTIAPYVESNSFSHSSDHAVQQAEFFRPYLTHSEMSNVQSISMNAETLFVMPHPAKETIKLRFHSSATEHGTHCLPEMFYRGVTFGITDGNPFQLQYTALKTFEAGNLLHDLQEMNPHPTYIMDRSAVYNSSSWSETGYGVYFSYVDLAKQGKLSSDRREPWKRVLADMLVIARDYHQVYLTVWYPHVFGEETKVKGEKTGETITVDTEDNSHRHEVIIQQIVPTRTGLNGIKSTSTVWMSAINNSAPHTFKPLRAYNLAHVR